MKKLVLVLALAAVSSIALAQKETLKTNKPSTGHDKEHQHVSAGADHEHDEAHHGDHDHKAHHPEHDEAGAAKSTKSTTTTKKK